MGFSFLSWNIRKFKASRARTKKVVDLIKKFKPDVFGILEFSDKDVARRLAFDYFKDYDFGITESRGAMEILVGHRRSKFVQAIFTQRREFNAGSIHLRPGAILSVRQKGQSSFDNILFLHTDSGTQNKDYQNRQIMFKKIWGLNKGLKNLPIQKGKARLVVAGDLNTMGKSGTVTATQEMSKLTNDATKNGMELLNKSHEKTWSSSGNKKSDLDHVMISQDVKIQQWYFTSDPNTTFPIIVDGWVDLNENTRKDFVKNISDHSLLFGEIL
jgi:endonuclease/exonuclease/phosphatase family metal-dependent hydrolase